VSRLPWRSALALLRRCLRALAALHARGLLHGDVHAGNLLVPQEEAPAALSAGGGSGGTGGSGGSGRDAEARCSRAVLVDLGSCQRLGADGRYRGPSRGGHWAVMAPEQFGPGRWAQGDVELAPAADVFAAAATFAHLVAGAPPFAPPGGPGARLSAEACGRGHALRAPDGAALRAHIAASAPGLPRAAAGAIARALHADPAARPGAAELLALLEGAESGEA
jgi:serine/threonine protein kinase